jgi:hypothetical protein
MSRSMYLCIYICTYVWPLANQSDGVVRGLTQFMGGYVQGLPGMFAKGRRRQGCLRQGASAAKLRRLWAGLRHSGPLCHGIPH